MADHTDDSLRNEIRLAIPWVLGALVLMAALSTVWWSLLDPSIDAGINELTIPEGTAAKIAAGEPNFAIPNDIVLARAGELRIINNDIVAHTIAGRSVLPGETVDIVASTHDGEFICSFHPGGALGFTVSGRGSLMTTIAVPTFILGLPIGLGLALAIAVARRIGVAYEASV